jgi:DNA ligase-1
VRAKQRTLAGVNAKRLTVSGVFGALQAIAAERGAGSQDRKKEHIKRMLVVARGVEAKYLVRTLEANLRTGANLPTVLTALAHAVVLAMRGTESMSREAAEKDMPVAAQAMRSAWDRHPNLGHITAVLLDPAGGWRALERLCPVTTGIPVEPMLGQITNSFAAMAAAAAGGERFACEVKYDGQRAQIHRCRTGRVRIFSRHLQDCTDRFADVAALFQSDSMVGGEGTAASDSAPGYPAEFVIDAELVAVDRCDAARLLPMQMIGTAASRAAGPPADAAAIHVGICIFAFDLLGNFSIHTKFTVCI